MRGQLILLSIGHYRETKHTNIESAKLKPIAMIKTASQAQHNS